MEWVEIINDEDTSLGQGLLTLHEADLKSAEENSRLPGHDSNSNSFRKHIQDLIELDSNNSIYLAKGKLIYTTGEVKSIGKGKWEVPFKTFHRFLI